MMGESVSSYGLNEGSARCDNRTKLESDRAVDPKYVGEYARVVDSPLPTVDAPAAEGEDSFAVGVDSALSTSFRG